MILCVSNASRMLKKAVLRSPVFSRHFLSKSESDPQKPLWGVVATLSRPFCETQDAVLLLVMRAELRKTVGSASAPGYKRSP